MELVDRLDPSRQGRSVIAFAEVATGAPFGIGNFPTWQFLQPLRRISSL